MQNLLKDLTQLLKKDDRFISQEGDLLKNVIQEFARKNDAELIKLLLSDNSTRKHFFFEVDKTMIFDKEKFIQFISNKQFLPDSYTAFKNKIGLTSDKSYLSENKEVVLSWPYKDCVLEGGMTKEDQKRDEIFYNETLAPDDIDRLLDPKIFTSFKRIDKTGEHKLDKFNRDENGMIKDNLIIKGNNLLALASLKKEFAGKVKLIYIDPPYNTGNDSFSYNDRFNHSSWLVFMKNRLEIAKNLLSEDGAIYIQLDYNEVHYAKILMDEIFGKQNFQREIIWDISVLSGYKTSVSNWIRGHDSILFYSKNNNSLEFNKVRTAHSEKYLSRFNKKEKESGRMYFDGRGKKLYLDEVIKKGKAVGDVWSDIISFQQAATAKERIKDFHGQKPENLLERIILSATNKGDIVLDYHVGTGTTLAAAHKMGRQYIGIEQMDYIETITFDRMQKVIEGEQGGISKSANWKGGGDFVYIELSKNNEKWIDRIKNAKSKKEIEKIWETMNKTAFLSYKIDPNEIDKNAKEFNQLDLKDQKRFLIECLDKNQLFVNLNEMNDKDFNISEEDKKLNKEFYNMK
jgi:adenine-specific DNA-methyltransferase